MNQAFPQAILENPFSRTLPISGETGVIPVERRERGCRPWRCFGLGRSSPLGRGQPHKSLPASIGVLMCCQTLAEATPGFAWPS
jgi:hypothetical protein